MKEKLPEWAELTIDFVLIGVKDNNERLRLKADLHEKWESNWFQIKSDVLPAMKDWTDREKKFTFVAAMKTVLFHPMEDIQRHYDAALEAKEKLKGIVKSANTLVDQIRDLEAMAGNNDIHVNFVPPWVLLRELEPECRDWSLDEPAYEDLLSDSKRVNPHGKPTSSMVTLIEAFANRIKNRELTILSQWQGVFASRPRKDTGKFQVLLDELLGILDALGKELSNQAIATLISVALDRDPPMTADDIKTHRANKRKRFREWASLLKTQLRNSRVTISQKNKR